MLLACPAAALKNAEKERERERREQQRSEEREIEGRKEGRNTHTHREKKCLKGFKALYPRRMVKVVVEAT